MAQRYIPRFSALLAAALAVPAGAGERTASCPGENGMSEDSGTTIVTSGSGHSRVIVQDDPEGAIRVEQHGQDHAALAIQSGHDGQLSIAQSGKSAKAEVSQNGACNATELAQAGSANRATISQTGNGNRAVVRQGPAKE